MKDNEKTLGVIGGMGPLASHLFYKMVIDNTDAHKDQEHLNMIILNHATMPDRTECIINHRLDDLLAKLAEDAKLLETGGADYLVIPCNTCHVLAEALQERTGVKVINMIQVTAEYIRETYGEGARVGIMGTDGTVQSGLYQKKCQELGLVPVNPSPENQERVMRIIYDGIKDGGHIDYHDFEAVEAQMKEENCRCAILACTELSCFKEMYNLGDYYVDAMELVAKKAILLCGKTLRRKPTDD